MDAQGTMRLMFDTMDAYDRGDFDRLGEIYAEDARWTNVDPKRPHCRNRDQIFAMFRSNMASGVRIKFDEMRSTPTQVVLTARVDGLDPVVSVFGFEGRRIVTVTDYSSMEAADQALAGRGWPVVAPVAPKATGFARRLIRDQPLRRFSPTPLKNV